MTNLNILELYSGIGGMHFALKVSGIPGEIITAADINTVANLVYEHNFPGTKILSKNILSLTPAFIDDLKVDMILMSPPCQPHTRNGKKEDVLDRRSDSLTHITQILPKVNHRFQYLLLENVSGFEASTARTNLIELIKDSFHISEFKLNPLQFGIPNSRERYYLLARRKPFTFSIPYNSMITDPLLLRKNSECFSIKDILQFSDNSEQYNDYLVPIKTLMKRVMIMDIVTKESSRSCCFTKAYGRFIEGTGSIYCPLEKSRIKEILDATKTVSVCEKEELLKELKLRFFTPEEISKLMCFPNYFHFPIGITVRQKYSLLGNSINVQIVSDLIKLLLT